MYDNSVKLIYRRLSEIGLKSQSSEKSIKISWSGSNPIKQQFYKIKGLVSFKDKGKWEAFWKLDKLTNWS